MELARQLTIIESLHFQRIKAIECLNKAWAREDGPKAAPNVRWVILTANRMAGWVALQILSSKDVKTRASIMKYFVQTAIVGLYLLHQVTPSISANIPYRSCGI